MYGKPLVSIITIFLNEEKFLHEAVESVFSQTYDNWELVLVDDGSTDASTEIAQGYSQQFPDKIRYFDHDNHQNRGMSASRNLGIRNAGGQYITFLDGDDVLLPDKLEEQIRILEPNPHIGMVCGSTQYWYSWTGNPEDAQKDVVVRIGVLQDTVAQPPVLLTLLYPLGEAAAPCVSAILIRKKIVEEVGGFEEVFRGMYEDQAFLTKVYLRTPVFIASASWDRYRQHPDSCLSIATRTGQYDAIRQFFLNWLEKYLSEQGAKDTEAWKLLQNLLWPYRHPILHRIRGQISYLFFLASRKLRKSLA